MKNFDIRRFCAVARWDLTINRAFYNKMALVIAACSILPVLFYHAIEMLDKVMFERLLSLRALDTFLFGTAIVLHLLECVQLTFILFIIFLHRKTF